jgi:membrane-bound lytic murein transglycosylase D
MRVRASISTVPLLASIVWLLLAVGSAGASEPPLDFGPAFPVSEAMAERVRFWVRVFTAVSDTEVVLHDRDRLGMVYDVVPRGRVTGTGAVEAARTRYDRVLTTVALAELRPGIHPISPERQRVVGLFMARGLGPRAVANAVGNIRAQRGMRESFALGLMRAELYLPTIRRLVREAAVPAELAYLPHVESSFNPNAVSRSHAVGLWQLTRPTARRYLTVHGGRDERLDPARATEAAVRHLARAHAVLGSWPLAVTAYNHGIAGMVRARAVAGDALDDVLRGYESASFGFASKNFYAEFLAAVHVARHADVYFPNLELKPFLEYRVRRGDSLWKIARRHRISVRTLMAVNSLRGTRIREGQRLVIATS